ncbi:DUF3313 domain-containing protein [Desulfobulbus sp.]|uniref:DUF3313 domain-containing protein n=1 Tax=Desulfobulbus sp. TaxID=895 RepID=UPI00286F3A8B|nr:DUF3313 domain-containing protein [Desulfobulbus sp.]
MKIHHVLMTGLLILACGTLIGCASSKAKPSGFLGTYPQFQPGPSDGIDQVYTKPGMELGKYNKVMIDEVQFFLKKNGADQGLQASDMKALSDSFHRSIFEALGNAYPLVTEPGPDVLRIRMAITDIETSSPVMNGITTVIPVGLAISVAKKATTGGYTGVGGASMEVELLDSLTNERLAAGIDTFDGSKMSGFSKLGSAEEAFEFWAKRLRVTLDKTHGKMAQ